MVQPKDKMATIQVLGCLMKNPMLIVDDRYRMCVEDFPERFHQILYGAIDNMAKSGVQDLNSISIDDYLSKYPRQYRVFCENKGMEYVENAVEMAQLENFDYYYQTFRKFGLLGQLEKKGFDTTFIYDSSIIDVDQLAEMQRRFDECSIEDIFNYFEVGISELKEAYDNSSDVVGVQAAKGMSELKEQYKKAPEMGMPMGSAKLTTIARGRRLKKLYLKSAPSGFGKALPNDSMIPTPDGWRAVGDIKVGDYLFGQDGKPTKVLNVFPQGMKQVWNVYFKDGRVVPCCEDHLWEYYNIGTKEDRLLVNSTKEIYERAKDLGGFYSWGFRYSVRLNKPVEYPYKKLYPAPYVMGALLGNGSFRYAKTQKGLFYSSEDEEMPNRIASLLGDGIIAKKNSKFNYNYTFKSINNLSHNLWVQEILKNYPELWMAKSGDKFIPDDYLKSNVEQRFALLQGLMDTDGSIQKDSGSLVYFTTSVKLKDNIIELCRSLGMTTQVTLDSRKDSVCYCIGICCDKFIKKNLFRLHRKEKVAEDYVCNNKRNERRDRLAITNIEPTNKYKEMTCFVVDNKDHLFLANDFIVTHNSRVSVGDAAYVSIPYYYDINNKEWINTGYNASSLIITTELEIDEVQSLIMAYVSGVPEEHILDGVYASGEEERVDKAIQYINESKLFIEQIPNFNIEDVENVIKKYKLKYQVGYVWFDYIHTSMKILNEVANKTRGVKLREDNVLLMFADRMKTLANTLNVHIDTSTQVNGEWRNVKNADMNLIRNCKAIADKVDLGMVMLPVSEADKLGIEQIVAKNQGFLPEPNLVYHVYKNRRGKLNHIRVFVYFDYSTCRTTDLFVTDNNYNLIDVDSTLVSFTKDYEEDVDYMEALSLPQPDDYSEDEEVTPEMNELHWF